MFEFEVSEKLCKTLQKISKKDKPLFIKLKKKIGQIIEMDTIGINHFKNLRGNLSKFKRVHIGSFILIFQLKESKIFFEDFTHHDFAY